jgi:hypothetical protein
MLCPYTGFKWGIGLPILRARLSPQGRALSKGEINIPRFDFEQAEVSAVGFRRVWFMDW